MKILCVIDSLGSGGAQRQLVELAKGFKERGHEVNFLIYHDVPFYNESLKRHSIGITCIEEKNYIMRLWKMRHFIRKGKFDAVLSFLEAPNFICEIAGLPWRKWKLIVGERSANPNILKSPKLRIYRWVHVLADYVVANSHSNMDMVRSICPLLPKRKCKVIYNMVDFEKWKPSEDYIPRKEGKLHLIVASSHQYLKNLAGLVEAVHLLTSEEKRTLRIDWYGGNGLDNSKVISESKIRQYGVEDIFNFNEPILALEDKMKKVDVVGLFSFYEGLPNAVCEGMACGKPIVATKVSDMPLLIEEGVNGFLTENITPESIKNALQKILICSTTELKNYGINGNIKARKLFNKDFFISSYENLFTDR